MRKAICAVVVAGLLVPARAEDWVEKKFVFSRTDTQQHLWLSAGGTFLGSSLLRVGGMSKPAAIGLSCLAIAGAGLAKEFARDDSPSANDLAADGLGILLGAAVGWALPIGERRGVPASGAASFGSLPRGSRLSLAGLP